MDNEIRNELKDIRQQLTKLTDLVNKLIESSDQMVNDSIKNEIKEIRQDLKQLTELVTQLLFDSQKMVNHIEFIESTYNVARAPLDFMVSNINKIMGRTIANSLPEIDN